MAKEIKFSLVYRDMWQSSGKYQPRVDQLEKIAPVIVEMGCFDRIETNGGAFEQVNLMYGENPNKAVRAWTKPFNKAGIQTHMLERALNGLRMYGVPKDVRQLMPKVKKAQGVDIMRSFCGLNDPRNLELSVKYAKEAGMISQAALSITHSPVHTVEYYMGIVDKLVNDIGFDGVYIDQIAAAKPQLCCDPTHNHLSGGGTWWNESYYNLIDHVSRVQDPAILATECTAEMFMKHIQAYLSWLWVKNRQVPAFPVLYSNKVVTFGLCYQSFRGEGARDGLSIFFAQSLLFGQQMGWMSPAFYKEMPEQAFFKKCVLLRKQFREFFFGTMLRPPKLKDDAPVLRYENCPHAYFKTVEYPAVQGALWQAKDGRKLLMLTNSQTMEVNASMEVDLPDGEYTLEGDVQGILTVTEGKAEVTIPATGVVWAIL